MKIDVDFLAGSKIAQRTLQHHIAQYKMIEVQAKGCLESAGIDYDVLDDDSRFVIMIGAAKASIFAEKQKVVPADSQRNGFGIMFFGFLKNIIPHNKFVELGKELDDFMCDDIALKRTEASIEEFGISRFEATIMTMSVYIASHISTQLFERIDNGIEGGDQNRIFRINKAILSFYMLSKVFYEC